MSHSVISITFFQLSKSLRLRRGEFHLHLNRRSYKEFTAIFNLPEHIKEIMQRVSENHVLVIEVVARGGQE